MAQLSTKVILYLESKSKTFESEKENFLIQDDGQGPYINEWNVTGVTKPTDGELNALESDANTKEAGDDIINNRMLEYPSIQECVHAILDDDLDALQTKRAAVKAKYPKPS